MVISGVHVRGVTAEVLSDAANELSFRLPFEASPYFAELFDSLDSRLGELGVSFDRSLNKLLTKPLLNRPSAIAPSLLTTRIALTHA